jgi:hypothetical protein
MDDALLTAARRAQEQLIEAEHAAEVAKAEFHRAVRRLHLSGASLRELAAVLHLSHQRVHQIVETAGGGRRWGRRSQLPSKLACSFCARPQRKARRLVAGPDIYICAECVEAAEGVVHADGSASAQLVSVESETTRRCGFCGKRRHQVTGLVGARAGDATICSGCLGLCREIHSEQLT